ncbi:hypothetical protein FHX52_3884 [Humibacillus xanthopallidus]|uniref:Anti-bacteriophage protein A/HamA C-terminal domain-containing protein n=1 Tax=Humibacillus xanthopallidus TaxID=412689 RepID=A0A543PKS7_9MICO|nr:DUF1837 domain-containing protein [Humibacillus xanthopallidus]TQN44664.1 hypothetical protein FHX52_3884 [Humibacillus xanthopallidus]
MEELGLDLAEVRSFFSESLAEPYVMVSIGADRAAAWTQLLGVPARRCYIADGHLQAVVDGKGLPYETVVGAVMPDKGSVMAGDYGEIVTALYLASRAHPDRVLEPKMWRLKSGRTKPSQGSDVVQFQLPHWPTASEDDVIVCAEVKTKSTNGTSTPIASAIADSRKDRESRLVKTLMWLKEKAILGDLGTVKLDHLERFVRATDHPPAKYEFRAVAVISSDLVEKELAGVTPPGTSECTLVVISVPDLKENYERLYEVLMANSDVDVLGA